MQIHGVHSVDNLVKLFRLCRETIGQNDDDFWCRFGLYFTVNVNQHVGNVDFGVGGRRGRDVRPEETADVARGERAHVLGIVEIEGDVWMLGGIGVLNSKKVKYVNIKPDVRSI